MNNNGDQYQMELNVYPVSKQVMEIKKEIKIKIVMVLVIMIDGSYGGRNETLIIGSVLDVGDNDQDQGVTVNEEEDPKFPLKDEERDYYNEINGLNYYECDKSGDFQFVYYYQQGQNGDRAFGMNGEREAKVSVCERDECNVGEGGTDELNEEGQLIEEGCEWDLDKDEDGTLNITDYY
ncbi:MAG: hypothetical protein EZS28_015013 [Streblomastix strix]|uniref:EF-hand domain-containing protein n=1 Tax=Streblomastix strix TaxID=222440 RepID=A0A5J4W455_9EUKA|nr:MAG: hypothetical protein EZS28_015013 [Streblomastix strix]